MQDIVKINQNDNVAVALRPLNEGETLDVAGEKVTLVQDIPQGHKFALRAIAQGEEVVKYGFRIGYAKEAIEKGAWVHVHNVKTALGDVLSYEYRPEVLHTRSFPELSRLPCVPGCPDPQMPDTKWYLCAILLLYTSAYPDIFQIKYRLFF